MRLDVSANFINSSTRKRCDYDLGGKQKTQHTYKRSSWCLHSFLDNKVKNGIYNAGFENLSILKLENNSKKIDCKIQIKKDNDSRSYNLTLQNY